MSIFNEELKEQSRLNTTLYQDGISAQGYPPQGDVPSSTKIWGKKRYRVLFTEDGKARVTKRLKIRRPN